MRNDQPLMNVTMDNISGDRKVSHFFQQLVGLFMASEEVQVTINKCINIESMPHDPLLIPPVAGGLLGNQVTVGRTLICHPGQGFLCSLLKESRFAGHLPKNAESQ